MVGVHINTVKTTFLIKFDVQQAFYKFTSKQREANTGCPKNNSLI